MISISQLGKSFGDQVLFEGASLQFRAGERYGSSVNARASVRLDPQRLAGSRDQYWQ